MHYPKFMRIRLRRRAERTSVKNGWYRNSSYRPTFVSWHLFLIIPRFFYRCHRNAFHPQDERKKKWKSNFIFECCKEVGGLLSSSHWRRFLLLLFHHT